MTAALRFGAILDSISIATWQSECLDAMVRENLARLELVVLNDLPVADGQSRTDRAAWAIFKRWFGGCPLERHAGIAPLAGKRLVKLSDGSREAADELSRLDFAIDFSSRALPPFREFPRHGIWSFSHSRCDSFALRELLDRKTVYEVALVCRRSAGPDRVVLRRGWFGVERHSYRATRQQIFAGCLDFPALACRQILGGSQFPTKSGAPVATRSHRGLVSLAAKASLMLSARALRLRAFREFFRRQWNIGVADASRIDPFVDAAGLGVRWLPQGEGRDFVADCFIHAAGDRRIILAEYVREEDGRGVIAAWRGHETRWDFAGIVIEEPDVHLSYPFLFDFEGDTYCLPERAEAGPPLLYRAISFPDRWERVGEMLPGVRAIDPTVFEYDGRWWLAHTDPVDRQGRLMMWHASSPLGPWKPHRKNPVKIDPRSARGAGRPFIYQGALIRPAQDCSVIYGARIVFNWVVELTPETFSEEPTGSLAPDPGGPCRHGLHTISMAGGVAAIDGSRYAFDPLAWLRSRRSKRNKSERIRRVQGPLSERPAPLEL